MVHIDYSTIARDAKSGMSTAEIVKHNSDLRGTSSSKPAESSESVESEDDGLVSDEVNDQTNLIEDPEDDMDSADDDVNEDDDVEDEDEGEEDNDEGESNVVESDTASSRELYDRYHDSAVSDFEHDLGKDGFDDDDVVTVSPEDIDKMTSSRSASANMSRDMVSSDIKEDIPVEVPSSKKRSVVTVTKSSSDRSSRSSVDKPVSVPKVVKSGNSANAGKTSYVRDIPSALLSEAKTVFPTARNNTELVTAFLYHFLDNPSDIEVSDDVVSLANEFTGNDYTTQNLRNDLQDDLDKLRADMKRTIAKLDALEMALTYLICDRIGFRKRDQRSPGTIDFLEQCVIDMMHQLETLSAQHQSREATRKGRPRR